METIETPQANPQPPAEHDSPAVDPRRLRDFVEEFALVMEAEGLPRMAGRIFGYLQVCEPAERTAADLARELHASIGSISSMTRLLVSAELVERISRPGERADRFRVTPESLSALMRGSTARLTRLRRITARGLDVLAARPPGAKERLEAFHDLYLFFEQAMPGLVEEWERRFKEDRR